MSNTAHFDLLFFSVDVEDPCPSTVVGAEFTAVIDASTYFGKEDTALALGGRAYGAPFTSVVLDLEMTSHTATVVFTTMM